MWQTADIVTHTSHGRFRVQSTRTRTVCIASVQYIIRRKMTRGVRVMILTRPAKCKRILSSRHKLKFLNPM